jgi:hypothetical protein
MAYVSIPHIISSDDVIPAEGMQKVVDTCNLATTTMKVQHSRSEIGELDHRDNQFLIARFMFRQTIDFRKHKVSLDVVTRSGIQMSVYQDPDNPPYGFGFTIDEGYVWTGAHIIVRYSSAILDLDAITPIVYPGPQPYYGLISFTGAATAAAIQTVEHISVLLRGYRLG